MALVLSLIIVNILKPTLKPYYEKSLSISCFM